MRYILLFLILNVILGCSPRHRDVECGDDAHSSYVWKNNSDRPIIPQMYFNRWPDTTIGEYNPTGFGIIEPGKMAARGIGRDRCMESVFKERTYYFIFDADSLDVIPWDTVRATNRGLLERREVDLQYFIDHDFIITYP